VDESINQASRAKREQPQQHFDPEIDNDLLKMYPELRDGFSPKTFGGQRPPMTSHAGGGADHASFAVQPLPLPASIQQARDAAAADELAAQQSTQQSMHVTEQLLADSKAVLADAQHIERDIELDMTADVAPMAFPVSPLGQF
jgi:hypothetical protein